MAHTALKTKGQTKGDIVAAALALFLPLLAPAVAGGQDLRLPVDKRIAILFKALTYDHRLKERCADGLRIGVVALAGNQESMAVAGETLEEMRTNSGVKVAGLQLVAELVQISSGDELKGSLQSRGLNILYLSSGLEPALPSIFSLAEKHKLLTITGEAGYAQAGAAISAVLREEKPKILVHAGAASDQGAVMDARLLRLAEVIQPSSSYQPPEVVKKRRIAGREPDYPPMARTARLEAKILVKIFISPRGEVAEISFLKSNPHFEDEVRRTIETWRFSPHKINGRPVGTNTVYRFDFKLD